jgi:hypothetical protein
VVEARGEIIVSQVREVDESRDSVVVQTQEFVI